MPDLWKVRLQATDPKLLAEAWLGESVPTPSGGGGGHDVLVLPKRRPVIVWRNAQLWVLTFEMVFDRFVDDGSAVADDFADLIRMWRPLDETDEPPTLRIDCEGDAVPLQHLSYVMTGLDWGEAEANRVGNRARQRFVVTLTEYNPDERLDFGKSKTSPSKARNTKGKASKGRTVKVKAGDTLSEIAQRENVKGGWRALGAAQKPPITQPRSIKVGQTLKIP